MTAPTGVRDLMPRLHRYSLEGKLAFLVAFIVLFVAAMAVGVYFVTGQALLSLLFTLSVSFPLCILAVRRFMGPVNDVLQALTNGIASLQDNDFSTSVAVTRSDEIGELVAAYNELGSTLRSARQDIFQRELLLDTVIQSTPLALVLCNARDAVVYSNSAARRMFVQGRRLEGHNFQRMLMDMPEPVRDAVAQRRDVLFSVGEHGEQETYHLSQREFVLNAQPHSLYLFKRLTREINRQEVATWKKVIRVIGHELNNSLAPISSLAHSGTLLLDEGSRVNDILGTIEERANHLKLFIDGYARFAKLPMPKAESVVWATFFKSLEQTVTFRVRNELPGLAGYFDPVQIEQVLINLIKNAHESGSASEDIEVSVQAGGKFHTVHVLDRGPGMTDEILQSALLPFYSTKQKGSGLGLALCREIVEAHGGRLSLANRQHGGLRVKFSLPLND